MHRLFLCFQTIFIVLSVLLLAGCANPTEYVNSISNKNGGSVGASEIPQPGNATSKCQNQNWCHNGWCSTHCEEATSAN